MVNSSFVNDDSTIAAIATAAGMGGVGVIRISGPAAFTIALQITHLDSIDSHRAHFAAVAALHLSFEPFGRRPAVVLNAQDRRTHVSD